MVFGRDSAKREQRAQQVHEWCHARSLYALVAGMLGIIAPIDGLIFFPFALAAVIVGILGLRDLKKRPALLGKRLCILGIVGGTIGLTLAMLIHFLPTA